MAFPEDREIIFTELKYRDIILTDRTSELTAQKRK